MAVPSGPVEFFVILNEVKDLLFGQEPDTSLQPTANLL